MQKFLIFMFVTTHTIFAQESAWNAFQFTLGGLGGNEPKNGRIIHVVVQPERGSELGFGPVLMWEKNGGTGKLVQISNSLGALSSAIGEITLHMPETEQRDIIKNAIGDYCRSIRSVLLVGEERKAFLVRLAKEDSPKAAEQLAIIAPDLFEQWKQSDWKLSFSLVSDLGAIERHTFVGQLAPFSIRSHETGLIDARLSRRKERLALEK